MKKCLFFILMSVVFVFVTAKDIVFYKNSVSGVILHYEMGDIKIGISDSPVAGKNILKTHHYNENKNYYIITLMDKNKSEKINSAIFEDFYNGFYIIETDAPIFEKRQGWEIYKISFKNKIDSKATLFDYIPELNRNKSLSEMDSILNVISEDSLYNTIAVLSGKNPYPQGTYAKSRVMVTTWLDTAFIYLKAKMDSMGFDSVYSQQFFVSTYSVKNVVGLKRGTVSHDTCIVVGAHYDDYSSTYLDAPGADDNASGSAGVLETARALMGTDSDYDIYFVLFTGEEWGLYGSDYFVNEYIIPNNMHVLGMVNYDMIGFNPSPSYEYDLYGMTHSMPLKNIFKMMADTFTTLTTHILGSSSGSDHYPFDVAGFKAAFAIEYDFSPVYHSPQDTIELLNFDFMKQITMSGAGTVLYLARMPLSVSSFELYDNGDSSVTVSWDKVINSDIEGYRIYYIKDGDSVESMYEAPDTNRFTIEHLSPQEVYTFTVSPFDTEGIEAFAEISDTITPSFVPNAVILTDIFSDSENVYLTFSKSNSGDFSHYNVYRKKNASGSYSVVSATNDTTFIDSAITDSSAFYYYVTAVDTASYESSPSNILACRTVTRVKGLLVIDETINTLSLTDIQTDAYYDTILGNYIYDILDADTLSATSLLHFGLYKEILYIDDDLTANKINFLHLYKYLENGGKIIFAGWNSGRWILENPEEYPAYADTSSNAHKVFSIDVYNRNTLSNLDYIYYQIEGNIDTLRFEISKLPRGSNGNLIYGSVYDLNDDASPLGFYHSATTDTAFDGKSIFYITDDSSKVVVGAPLYYMNTSDAKNLVSRILSLWNAETGVCIEKKRSGIESIEIASFTRENIGIEFINLAGEYAGISVFDCAGRIIAKKNLMIINSREKCILGENLNSGIYFIEINSDNINYRNKVLLIK